MAAITSVVDPKSGNTVLKSGNSTSSAYSSNAGANFKPRVAGQLPTVEKSNPNSKFGSGTTDAKTGKGYIDAWATPQQYKDVYQQYGIIPKDSTPNPGSSGGGGGGGGTTTPNYSGMINYLNSNTQSVASPYSDKDRANAQSQIDAYIKQLKGELETGQKNANKLAKDVWSQSLAEYKNNLADANNASNREYKLAEKRMNNLYGENTTGTGLSQLAANMGNWANAITANRRAYTDARNQAQNLYNQTVNNNNDYYRQQWANTYFPYLTSEANNIRNYDNQLKMYEMQAQQNRLMNQDDLNYRLQLAQMGLL